jgi:hypothetical protein
MPTSTRPSFLPCTFLPVALWFGCMCRSRGSLWVSGGLHRSPIRAADAFAR